jgi:hypothetical protein
MRGVTTFPEAYGAPRRLLPREALPAVVTLLAAGLLAGAAAWNNTALGLALFAVQAVVTLAWLALNDVDGGESAAVLVGLAAAAADVLAVRRQGEDVAAAAGVVGLAFVAALALQLFRTGRQRTAEALAGTISAVVLAVFAAHLLATSAKTGAAVVATGVLCAAAALVAGRAGDAFSIRPALAAGARRGAPGFALGAVAGAGLGAVLGGAWSPLSVASGTALGAATAIAAALADLAIDLVAADAIDDRRAAALRPLSVLLPLVVAAPVAYAAARLLIG